MTQPDAAQLFAGCDADGRVRFDLPCTGCGYNLRGTGGEGHCPECGAAVANSLDTRLLRFADWRWLTTLESGFRSLLGAGYVYLAALFLAATVFRPLTYPGTVLLSLAPGTLLAYVAWGWLTSAEPAANGHDSERSGDTARLAARYGGAVVVILWGVLACRVWQRPTGSVMWWLLGATGLAMTVTVVAAAAHWAHLADRSGDPLARRYPIHLAIATAVFLLLAGATALVFLAPYRVAHWLPFLRGRFEAAEQTMIMVTIMAAGAYVAGFGYAFIKLYSRVKRERRAADALRQSPVQPVASVAVASPA
jgi:hypothetical protein